MRKDKTRSQSAVKRDLSAIALPTKLPLAKLIAKLQDLTYTAIKTGNTADIERICKKELLDLLDAGTEVAILKGGRRGQLSSEKVIDEPAKEIIPVRFSLQDEGTIQAQGTSAYLKKVSGLDPTKTSDKFKQQNAGLINGLSKEICDTIKKTIADLTRLGVHVKGGKQEINNILVNAGLDPAAAPRLAETIFRTQTAAAYNAGRWNVVNDSDTAPYIWGFEYCTAGDRRVRPEHRLLEGVRLPKDDPFWKKYLPPNGWNCRCTVLEIWNDEDIANIDFGITGVDPRKRSDKELNLLPAFAGNVGVLSQGKPVTKTSTPKPSVTTKPTKPVKPVTKPVETKKTVTEPIPVTQPKKEEKQNESQKPIQSTPGTANPHTAETQTEEVTLVYDIKPDIETFNRSNQGSKTFNLYVVPVEGGKEFDIQDWKGVTVGKIKQRGVSFGVDSYRWEGRVESSLIKQSNAILDVLKAVLERVSKDRYNAKVTECTLIYGKKQGTTLQLPDTWEKFVKESRTTVKQLVNLQPKKSKNFFNLKEGANNYNLQWIFKISSGNSNSDISYYKQQKKFGLRLFGKIRKMDELVTVVKDLFEITNKHFKDYGWEYVESNAPVTGFSKLINLPEYSSTSENAKYVGIGKTDKSSNTFIGTQNKIYTIGYNRFSQKYILFDQKKLDKNGEIIKSFDDYVTAVKYILDKIRDGKEICLFLTDDTQSAKDNIQENIKPYKDVILDNVTVDEKGKIDVQKLNSFIDNVTLERNFPSKRTGKDCDRQLEMYGVDTIGRVSIEFKNMLLDVFDWISRFEFAPSSRVVKMLSKNTKVHAGASTPGTRLVEVLDKDYYDLLHDAKNQEYDGWWSSGSPYQSFVHEDTHLLMEDICDVLGGDRMTAEFKPILDKIGAGKYSDREMNIFRVSYVKGEIGKSLTSQEQKEHDIYKKIITEFSAYGSTISADGTIWQEACAEARAEVLCNGKNARPFAREIYAKIIELYIEAKNKK